MMQTWTAFRRDPFIMRHTDFRAWSVQVESPEPTMPAQREKLEHVRFNLNRTCSNDATLVEESQRWTQPAPAFVLNLSCTGKRAWTSPASPSTLHATYHLQREQVMLFGPNHLVSSDGDWTCETESRPDQHIGFFNSAAYQHIYRGAKPVIRPTLEASSYNLSIGHIADDDIAVIEGEVFLATPLEPDNWGRWLSTVIPKIDFFRAQGLASSTRLLCRSAKSWQKTLLATLGLEWDAVIDQDPGRTYFCPRVRTLAYSAADLTPSAGERNVHANLVERYGVPQDRRTRLYVSRLARSIEAPKYRVLTNEAILVDRLVELGFQVINPEQHGFTDQIRMFSAADVVVGLGGAGLFNVVFCRPGTKIVTIESSEAFINDHSRLFAACGLEYGVIFGQQDPDDPAPVHKKWSIDVDRTLAAVKAFL